MQNCHALSWGKYFSFIFPQRRVKEEESPTQRIKMKGTGHKSAAADHIRSALKPIRDFFFIKNFGHIASDSPFNIACII